MTADICSQCGPGFVFNYVSRTCENVGSLIANCKYYTDKATCKVCNDGFMFYGGKCEACITNCKNCNTNPAKCDICNQGFSHLSTILQTCSVSCTLPNCLQCGDGSTTACKFCNDGYRLNKFSLCEQCSISNCLKCTTSISKCDYSSTTVNNCKDGFYYLNDTCQACSDGCRICDNDGQCQGCNTAAGKYMWTDMQCFRGGIFGACLGIVAVVYFALL